MLTSAPFLSFLLTPSRLLNENKFKPPKRGKHNDNSHPPIHPIKHADNLTGKEKQVCYEMEFIQFFSFMILLPGISLLVVLKMPWGKKPLSPLI